MLGRSALCPAGALIQLLTVSQRFPACIGDQGRAKSPAAPAARDPRLDGGLAGAYEIRASESVTALCPRDIPGCEPPGAQGEGDAVGLWERFDDHLLVFLHVLLPRDLAESLPRIDHAWAGKPLDGRAGLCCTIQLRRELGRFPSCRSRRHGVGFRLAKLGHPVKDVASDHRLSRLCLAVPRPQAASKH